MKSCTRAGGSWSQNVVACLGLVSGKNLGQKVSGGYNTMSVISYDKDREREESRSYLV